MSCTTILADESGDAVGECFPGDSGSEGGASGKERKVKKKDKKGRSRATTVLRRMLYGHVSSDVGCRVSLHPLGGAEHKTTSDPNPCR